MFKRLTKKYRLIRYNRYIKTAKQEKLLAEYKIKYYKKVIELENKY